MAMAYHLTARAMSTLTYLSPPASPISLAPWVHPATPLPASQAPPANPITLASLPTLTLQALPAIPPTLAPTAAPITLVPLTDPATQAPLAHPNTPAPLAHPTTTKLSPTLSHVVKLSKEKTARAHTQGTYVSAAHAANITTLNMDPTDPFTIIDANIKAIMAKLIRPIAPKTPTPPKIHPIPAFYEPMALDDRGWPLLPSAHYLDAPSASSSTSIPHPLPKCPPLPN